MYNDEEVKVFENGYYSFKYFVKNIFSLSFEEFIGGKYIDRMADFLQNHPKTMRVSARDHFKSTSLYANFMWKLLYRPGREGHYFSFQKDLSGYHISKIKEFIRINPYFRDIVDLKPSAEGVIKYVHEDESGERTKPTTLEPHGLTAFKRGIHAEDIYVDDPYQDPANKLNTTVIDKINYVFRSQLMDMPKKHVGELHVVGTPQTTFDIYFNEEITSRFKVLNLPAEVDQKNKIALWPEWMDWEELQARRHEKGDRIYNQEYMCSPAWLEQAWYKQDEVLTAVNTALESQKKATMEGDYYLGWDLGKKAHPAYVAIFCKSKKKNNLIQVYSKFFDGMDYIEQLNQVRGLMKRFNVDLACFDSTRGELETFEEKGELPKNLQGVKFSRNKKFELATLMDKRILKKRKNVQMPTIQLINDRRMINQMLVVDNDLQALETPEGHGDSFWGIALAVYAADADGGAERFIMRF